MVNINELIGELARVYNFIYRDTFLKSNYAFLTLFAILLKIRIPVLLIPRELHIL